MGWWGGGGIVWEGARWRGGGCVGVCGGVCVCVCACVRVCVRACVRPCVCVHASVCASMHACVRAGMRACIRACSLTKGFFFSGSLKKICFTPTQGCFRGTIADVIVVFASEDIVYGTVHEDTLRSAVRASKTAEDTMDMGSIAAANAVLDELIKDEKKEVSEVKKRSLGVEDPEVDLLAQEKALELMEITATQVMITKIKVSSGRLEVQDDKMELVKEHEEKARRLIDANIVLVPIPSSEKKTREAIQASAAGKARGKDGKSFVGVFLDQGMFGEPITASHVRVNAVNLTVTKVCGCHVAFGSPACRHTDAIA